MSNVGHLKLSKNIAGLRWEGKRSAASPDVAVAVREKVFGKITVYFAIPRMDQRKDLGVYRFLPVLVYIPIRDKKQRPLALQCRRRWIAGQDD